MSECKDAVQFVVELNHHAGAQRGGINHEKPRLLSKNDSSTFYQTAPSRRLS
jgi:hypothetical protein